MYLEIHEAFSSLPEWNAWAETVPEIRTPDYLEDVARNICATGFVDPCAGLVPADEVDGGSRNYREGLVARAPPGSCASRRPPRRRARGRRRDRRSRLRRCCAPRPRDNQAC